MDFRAIAGLAPAWAGALIALTGVARGIAPVAADNAYPVPGEARFEVAAPGGVLTNDTPNGNVVEAVPVAGPAHGGLTLNPDGSFAYTPQAGFAGTDSFTYRLRTVPGPVRFVIDQAQSRMRVDATATTDTAGSASSSDDSRVAGTIDAALTPAAAPFSQAHITAVDTRLIDRLDLEFGFVCLPFIGCAATVEVHTRTAAPDWLRLSLETAGPPAPVSNNKFTQAGNTFRLGGVVDVEGTGLATSLITPGPQPLDISAALDIENCEITASATTLTLKMPATYTGRFFLDPEVTTTNYIDLTVRTAFAGSSGFIIATAPASANVPLLSNVATVTLEVSAVDHDLDDDGMPDAWETAHGLDPQSPADATTDADGDGQSNRAEFAANTDPRDPTSVLAVAAIVLNGGNVEITFSGLDPSREYQREESADFDEWTAAGVPFTPTTPTVTVVVAIDAPGRFHRLRVAGPAPGPP